MAAPGWVIYTISVKSRGLAPDPGEPNSASSPRGSPDRVTGKRAREGLGPALPLAPAPVWDSRQWGANGPLPLRCSPREQGRRRRLPFQESRLCHWRSAWAQHLRCPPVATANKLSCELERFGPWRHPLAPGGSGPELWGLLTWYL